MPLNAESLGEAAKQRNGIGSALFFRCDPGTLTGSFLF